jgi:hypothetical protein
MASYPRGSSPEDDRALEAMLGVQRERIPEEHRPEDNQSIAQLLGGIIEDAQLLVRREIDLAKQEVTVEINKVKEGATSLGLGVGLAAVGGIMLTLMLVYLLHEVAGLSLWVSYLLVGGVFAAVGGFLLMRGINRMKEVDPVPRETIESVKEDIAWIREQNPSDKT